MVYIYHAAAAEARRHEAEQNSAAHTTSSPQRSHIQPPEMLLNPHHLHAAEAAALTPSRAARGRQDDQKNSNPKTARQGQKEKKVNTMLKTNSKKARENVRAYIIANYDGSPYEYEETTEFNDIARNIYEVYKRERESLRESKNQNEQELFSMWMEYAPSIIDSGYYWSRPAVDDLGDILEETDEERNRYSEEKAVQYLTYLIFSEILKAVERSTRK